MTDWRPFARPRRAALFTGALLVVTAALYLLRAFPETAAPLDRLDVAWRDRMVAAEQPFWVAVALALDGIAGAWVTVPLRLLVAGLLWIRGLRDRFLLWVVAIVSAQVLTVLFKALYARPRPSDGLSATTLAAFPSGHTTQAAVTAFGLVLVLVPPGAARVRWAGVALGWTALVAWSRTYLRDHWLTDVIGGGLLGVLCVLAAGLLVERRLAASREPVRPGS